MLHLSVDVAHDCEFLQLFRLLSHEVLLPLSSEVIPPSLRSLCPCQAMSVLQVKNRLCLQDMAVAFEKEGCKLDVVDPYNLARELDIDPDVPLSSVSIVSFKGTGNLQWLEKGLGLKKKDGGSPTIIVFLSSCTSWVSSRTQSLVSSCPCMFGARSCGSRTTLVA